MRLSRKNIIFGAFFTGVILGSVYLAIIAASRGSKLLSLEKRRSALEARKSELTAELVAKSSLNEVAQSGEELGMQRPTQILYLNQQEPVAYEEPLKNF
jgi:hypothetical protein